jgi:nucleotide-binding universal stress UspA family protein
MYETILVPTDGSEHAERAAEHALDLARQFDATVHFLNVVDVESEAGLFSAGGASDEFVSRLETRAEEAVSDLEELAEPDDDVRTAVVRGKPTEGILDYADDEAADLACMGTHGRTGLNRYVAGSVTERVVRLADVPVFTVRATDRSVADGYDDVLIPTDGSDCAALGVDHGIAVAEKYGATVHAVSVVDVRTGVGRPGELADPLGEAEIVDQLEAQSRDAADAVAERAREAGLDAVAAVEEGTPARDLLDYADENDVDMIAMGTHGRTGVDRYFLGSTTAKLVRASNVPVLSVRSPRKEE